MLDYLYCFVSVQHCVISEPLGEPHNLVVPDDVEDMLLLEISSVFYLVNRHRLTSICLTN